jgi:hypothetical protein
LPGLFPHPFSLDIDKAGCRARRSRGEPVKETVQTLRLSRYGVIGMALVIALFVLILLLLAPKPGVLDPARRMGRVGAAIEMYAVRHDGRLPPDLSALADEGLLPVDFAVFMGKLLKYPAAGQSRDALPRHGVVALEDPSNVLGSIPVHVLLSDGAVLAVPADAVREAAASGALARVESAADGQLTVVVAAKVD